MSESTSKRWLWLLLVLSAAVRLWYFFEVKDTDLANIPLLDCQTYHDWAIDLISGNLGWHQAYWMGPLYPHLLAVVYAVFGVGGPAVLLLQLGLSLLNIFLVHRLATGLLALPDRRNEPAATTGTDASAHGIPLLAATLFALYGAPVFYAGVLLMATLLTTLFLVTAGGLVRAVRTPTTRTWFALGLMLGLTGLARGNVLLLLIVVPWLWWPRLGLMPIGGPTTRPWRPVVALILGTLLMLAPATLRNLLIADDFVLLTSNGGVNLLIGQQVAYKGMFAPVIEESRADYDPSMESTLESELGRDLKSSEVSRILTGRAWRVFRDNLSAMPLHYLRKAYRFWSGYELPQIVSYDYWKQEFAALKLLPLPFVVLSALGLLGVARAPRPARWILIVLLGSYFVSLMPFFPTSRYRQPLAPVLAISAAVYLIAIWRDLRPVLGRRSVDTATGDVRSPHRCRPILWAGGGLLLIALLLPRWTALDPATVTWQVHLHEASRASLRGDLRTTLAKGRQAEAARPGLAETPYHLSLYLEELGAHDEAVAALQMAAARDPDNPLVPYRLGRNLEKAGRHAEALAAYTRAIDLDPVRADPWLRRGLLLRTMKRPNEAVADLEEARRLDPGSRRIRVNLASLYAETGRTDTARDLLAQLVADFPDYLNGWFNLAVLNLQTGRPAAAAEALTRAAALPGLSERQRIRIDQLEKAVTAQETGP